MGVIGIQGVTRELLLVSTRHCYMVSEKNIFLSFSHNRSMGAITPQGVTSFEHKGLIGRIYVEHRLTLLHTCAKYKSCGPHGFLEVFFPL